MFQVGLGAPDEKFQASVGVLVRSIWMCWLLFTFIISTTYSSFLVSSLTIPKFQPVPETLLDFITSDYTLARVEWGDAIDDMIIRAQDSGYPALRKEIIWLNRTAWDKWGPLTKIDHKFAIVEQASDSFIAVMTAGPKDFMLSKAKWSCSPIAWAAPWNGIFNRPLNSLLKPMARFGILAKLRQRDREDYFKQNMSLLTEFFYGNKQTTASLTGQADEHVYLRDLSSVFLVLGIGYAAATVAFLGEISVRFFTCARSGRTAFYS